MTTQTSANAQKRAAGRSIPRGALLGVLSLLMCELIVVSPLIGGYDIGLSGICYDPTEREMFLITRVPRTFALMFAAIAMSVSGVIMQKNTQNRFVEPTTTGTTKWWGL